MLEVVAYTTMQRLAVLWIAASRPACNSGLDRDRCASQCVHLWLWIQRNYSLFKINNRINDTMGRLFILAEEGCASVKVAADRDKFESAKV
jgi:hypothetical protein